MHWWQMPGNPPVHKRSAEAQREYWIKRFSPFNANRDGLINFATGRLIT